VCYRSVAAIRNKYSQKIGIFQAYLWDLERSSGDSRDDLYSKHNYNSTTELFWEANYQGRPLLTAPYKINAGCAAQGGKGSKFAASSTSKLNDSDAEQMRHEEDHSSEFEQDDVEDDGPSSDLKRARKLSTSEGLSTPGSLVPYATDSKLRHGGTAHGTHGRASRNSGGMFQRTPGSAQSTKKKCPRPTKSHGKQLNMTPTDSPSFSRFSGKINDLYDMKMEEQRKERAEKFQQDRKERAEIFEQEMKERREKRAEERDERDRIREEMRSDRERDKRQEREERRLYNETRDAHLMKMFTQVMTQNP